MAGHDFARSKCVTWNNGCRGAPTLEEAIRSAIANANAAPIQVARVEIEANTFVPR